jgi:hypothetical protein
MQGYTFYLYLETALHVLGGTSTHHQELIQLYLQHLVFVTPSLLTDAISWNRFECAVGGIRHPQHTQTGQITQLKIILHAESTAQGSIIIIIIIIIIQFIAIQFCIVYYWHNSHKTNYRDSTEA